MNARDIFTAAFVILLLGAAFGSGAEQAKTIQAKAEQEVSEMSDEEINDWLTQIVTGDVYLSYDYGTYSPCLRS